MNNFFKAVFGAELGETLAQRILTPGKSDYLFADVNGNAVISSTAFLSDATISGSNPLCRNVQNHGIVQQRAQARGYLLTS